jgi:tRNA (mo5U34)-methyltransferase
MKYVPMQLRPDDPRLEGWYHTIDLGNGVVSQGFWDHRPVVERYGIPASLEGNRALDVGTADGFFAFELERRGAAEVVAINLTNHADLDWLPAARPERTQSPDYLAGFELARAALGSSVRFMNCNVYDLAPDLAGMFDVVFCGSLLLHVQNPIKALSSIRSVTSELAIIETTHDRELEARIPEIPAARFGNRGAEVSAGLPLGGTCHYWTPNSAGLVEWMNYAGFQAVELREPFNLPPSSHPVMAAHGRP